MIMALANSKVESYKAVATLSHRMVERGYSKRMAEFLGLADLPVNTILFQDKRSQASLSRLVFNKLVNGNEPEALSQFNKQLSQLLPILKPVLIWTGMALHFKSLGLIWDREMRQKFDEKFGEGSFQFGYSHHDHGLPLPVKIRKLDQIQPVELEISGQKALIEWVKVRYGMRDELLRFLLNIRPEALQRPLTGAKDVDTVVNDAIEFWSRRDPATFPALDTSGQPDPVSSGPAGQNAQPTGNGNGVQAVTDVATSSAAASGEHDESGAAGGNGGPNGSTAGDASSAPATRQ
jgi:hypothetical protein